MTVSSIVNILNDLFFDYKIAYDNNESKALLKQPLTKKHLIILDRGYSSFVFLKKLNLKTGEMVGYANTALGTPSILQPALAYSTGIGSIAAMDAWKRFENRSVKPDYSTDPQFAIIPRKQ